MSKWISVDDQLPETYGPPYTRYLVLRPNMLDDRLVWASIQYWVGTKWDIGGITHWSPLPPLPTN